MLVHFCAWKRGMTQYRYGDKVIPVTLLHIKPHDIFGVKDSKKDGYSAVCFSAGNERRESLVAKPLLAQFKKKSLSPRELIFEARLPTDVGLEGEPSARVDFSFLSDMIGHVSLDLSTKLTVGKGFAGAMKRWGFGGLRASHGVSVSHRSHGSVGQREFPGRVFKGKKMAGHYGASAASQQSLDLVLYDPELSLFGVHGSVPGPSGAAVFVKLATKCHIPDLGVLNNLKLTSSGS